MEITPVLMDQLVQSAWKTYDNMYRQIGRVLDGKDLTPEERVVQHAKLTQMFHMAQALSSANTALIELNKL